MDKKEFNKLLMIALASYIIAGFIFAVGLMMNNVVLLVTFYILALVMLCCGIMALYNNYIKNVKAKLLLFLACIGIMLLILISVAFITTVFQL